MVKLKEIKEYLDNNNLLIYDNLFKEYVKDKEIYIYGYDYINKYYKSILDNYNYKVIDYEYKDYAISSAKEIGRKFANASGYTLADVPYEYTKLFVFT